MSAGRLLYGTAKVALAIGLLVWLVRSGRLDFSVLVDVQSNWLWLLAAVAVYGLIQVMTAVRWRWLLIVANQECTLTRAFLITLASIFFNQVLIGSTGGDIYRALAFDVDDGRQRAAIAVSVAMDRLVGLYALIVIIPIAALWSIELIQKHELLILVVAGAGGAVIAVPVVIFLLLGRIDDGVAPLADDEQRSLLRRWLSYGLQGLAMFAQSKAILLKATIYSVVIQGLIVTTNLLLAFAIFGLDFDHAALFLLIPIALLIMAIPINPPGAIGTGEAAYSLLLEFAEISQGSVISILQRGLHFIWSIPGALFFALSSAYQQAVRKPPRRVKLESQE